MSPYVHGLRVLFLDIDGVLQCARTSAAAGAYTSSHTYHSQPERLDWTAIGMLRGLCMAGDIQVVLSSSWRTGMGPAELTKLAAFLGLPIVDATPAGWRERGLEIAEWLHRRGQEVEYAILDDSADMLAEQMPRLVQTSGDDGLPPRRVKPRPSGRGGIAHRA